MFELEQSGVSSMNGPLVCEKNIAIERKLAALTRALAASGKCVRVKYPFFFQFLDFLFGGAEPVFENLLIVFSSIGRPPGHVGRRMGEPVRGLDYGTCASAAIIDLGNCAPRTGSGRRERLAIRADITPGQVDRIKGLDQGRTLREGEEELSYGLSS